MEQKLKHDITWKDSYTFEELVKIVHSLRAPDGCPWDRAQTHESIAKCVTDEAQEVAEAIEKHDVANLKEELGDVLLQVLLHSEIAKEEEEFELSDVITHIAKKMIWRHPHVFGAISGEETNEGKDWEQLKSMEKRIF